MEPSEKEFLRKNKDELLELMRPSVQLNAYLEAKGFLKKGEQEEIDAKQTDSAKSKLLIDILEKKTGGFKGLIDSLDKTGQTGALALLNKYRPESLVPQPSVSQPSVLKEESKIETMKSADLVLVGGPDCGIPRVVRIVQQNSVGHAFLEDLSDFARNLDVVASKRKKILKSEDSDVEKLESILEQWKKDKSDSATLGNLLKVIRESQANSIADDIVRALKVVEVKVKA